MYEVESWLPFLKELSPEVQILLCDRCADESQIPGHGRMDGRADKLIHASSSYLKFSSEVVRREQIRARGVESRERKRRGGGNGPARTRSDHWNQTGDPGAAVAPLAQHANER